MHYLCYASGNLDANLFWPPSRKHNTRTMPRALLQEACMYNYRSSNNNKKKKNPVILSSTADSTSPSHHIGTESILNIYD